MNRQESPPIISSVTTHADAFLTTEERAELEKRTPAAIHAERHRGEGPPAVRIGRRLLWRRSDLEAYWASRIDDPALSRTA